MFTIERRKTNKNGQNVQLFLRRRLFRGKNRLLLNQNLHYYISLCTFPTIVIGVAIRIPSLRGGIHTPNPRPLYPSPTKGFTFPSDPSHINLFVQTGILCKGFFFFLVVVIHLYLNFFYFTVSNFVLRYLNFLFNWGACRGWGSEINGDSIGYNCPTTHRRGCSLKETECIYIPKPHNNIFALVWYRQTLKRGTVGRCCHQCLLR